MRATIIFKLLVPAATAAAAAATATAGAAPAFAGDLPHYAEAIADPTARGAAHAPEDVREHHAEFARIDLDGDGKLSRAELAASIAGEPVHEDEVAIFLEQLDGAGGFNRGNGDGHVDWAEYARALFGGQAAPLSPPADVPPATGVQVLETL
ncbi:MAG: hypothetical protein CL791_04690, partial [Chloroflexi bacterium]|nr:hypothetical protein [Chloroflexota bacterium]